MQELKYNEPWIMQRADPYIYKHESGMYYFTASVPAYDKIILRESDTLEGLADATEHGINMILELWGIIYGRRSCII